MASIVALALSATAALADGAPHGTWVTVLVVVLPMCIIIDVTVASIRK